METMRYTSLKLKQYLVSTGLAIITIMGIVACGDLETAQPATPGLARGEVVFTLYCNTCHPAGNRGSGPSLRGKEEPDDAIRTIVRQGKNRMPGFNEGSIAETDLNSLVLYVQSLK